MPENDPSAASAVPPAQPPRAAPTTPKKPLSPAAQRALAEAAERRAARDAAAVKPATEIGGRGGLDPVRYGDWETGGSASDF